MHQYLSVVVGARVQIDVQAIRQTATWMQMGPTYTTAGASW